MQGGEALACTWVLKEFRQTTVILGFEPPSGENAGPHVPLRNLRLFTKSSTKCELRGVILSIHLPESGTSLEKRADEKPDVLNLVFFFFFLASAIHREANLARIDHCLTYAEAFFFSTFFSCFAFGPAP